MKKILFLFFLIGLFFVADILSVHALNGKLTSASFYYINNNNKEDEFTNWHTLVGFDVPSDYVSILGNGYYNDMFPVVTNPSNNYYVAPNKFNIAFSLLDNTFNCSNSTATITFTIKAYRIDPNNNSIDSDFNSYNFWNGVEFWISKSRNEIDHTKMRKCTAISNTSSDLTVTCPYSQFYNNLHFHTSSEPFKDLGFDNGEDLLTHFAMSIRENILYECLEHPFLDLTSVVNKSTATITVNTVDSDIVGYYYYLPEVDGSEVYSTENTYIYENLSNGTYTVNVNALYKDGSKGSMSQTTFSITDSDLPVANFTLKQQSTTESGASISVDASSSYSSNSNISTYYYKLDDGQWYSSSFSNYTYVNVGFGTHYVYLKVQDSNGNFSTVVNRYINILTPYEENKSLLEKIIDFFGSFWTNVDNYIKSVSEYMRNYITLMFIDFLKATSRIFIPSQEYMSDWLLKMNTAVDNQMGFLSYPFTWTLNFLQRFVSLEDTGSYIIRWTNISVPNFDHYIIRGGSFDLATLLQDKNIKTAHDIYIMAVNALLLLAFLNTCWNKYNEVFGGSTVSYDIESVGDTTTFDSDGNSSTKSFVSNKNVTRRRRH